MSLNCSNYCRYMELYFKEYRSCVYFYVLGGEYMRLKSEYLEKSFL